MTKIIDKITTGQKTASQKNRARKTSYLAAQPKRSQNGGAKDNGLKDFVKKFNDGQTGPWIPKIEDDPKKRHRHRAGQITEEREWEAACALLNKMADETRRMDRSIRLTYIREAQTRVGDRRILQELLFGITVIANLRNGQEPGPGFDKINEQRIKGIVQEVMDQGPDGPVEPA